ncbi:MAG: hypothetical protein FD183_1321 [Chitinophagaceae bacterium]|nr:MAG: hypothetical protein FD183_1321 [Chitinophagaceae bacterium]
MHNSLEHTIKGKVQLFKIIFYAKIGLYLPLIQFHDFERVAYFNFAKHEESKKGSTLLVVPPGWMAIIWNYHGVFCFRVR